MDNKYLGSILNLDKWILKLDSKFHIFVCTVFHGNSNSFLWISSGVCNTVKINFDLILVSGSAAASPGILLKFQVLEPHLDLLNQKLQGWGPVMLFFFFLVLPVYCYQPISLHPHAYVLSHVTPWTAAHQAPLSMNFFRQEYWSGLPFPSQQQWIF